MKRIKWTDQLKVAIIQNCDKMTDAELAEHLSKLANTTIKKDTVRKQRQKLRLKKVPGRGKCELTS